MRIRIRKGKWSQIRADQRAQGSSRRKGDTPYWILCYTGSITDVPTLCVCAVRLVGWDVQGDGHLCLLRDDRLQVPASLQQSVFCRLHRGRHERGDKQIADPDHVDPVAQNQCSGAVLIWLVLNVPNFDFVRPILKFEPRSEVDKFQNPGADQKRLGHATQCIVQ